MRRDIIVDFPLPEPPTSATALFASIYMLMFLRV